MDTTQTTQTNITRDETITQNPTNDPGSSFTYPGPPVAVPLSPETLDILKYIAQVQPEGLLLSKGSVLTTRSTNKCIFVRAEIAETFPETVPIRSELTLTAISRFTNPVLHFHPTHIAITGDATTVTAYRCYYWLDLVPPKKEIQMPSVDVEVELDQESFSSFLSIAKTLGTNRLALQSDGKHLELLAQFGDHNNPTEVGLRLPLGNAPEHHTFSFVWKQAYCILPRGSYALAVSKQGLLRFTNKAKPIATYIALERNNSTWEGQEL